MHLQTEYEQKKQLGQHFLTSEVIAERIADTLSLEGYSHVIEIGPGTGVLTKFLIQKSIELEAIDLDQESVEYLNTTFKERHKPTNLTVRYADILKLDLNTIFTGHPIAITGNYPYNISSQIVFKMLDHRDRVVEFTGMFQKEVAQRICEKPGSKTYGILSVLVQAYYQASYAFTVHPEVFNPPPKVQSGVLILKRKTETQLSCSYSTLKLVVKTAFNQRRKTLRNSLKGLNIPLSITEDAIFDLRPEQLAVDAFVELSTRIEHGALKLTQETLDEIKSLIGAQNTVALQEYFNDFHYADIAEIANELQLEEALFLIRTLDSERTGDVLTELDEDLREEILSELSAVEIASELAELDTDDAADIITELPNELAQEVISEIEDREHAAEIIELLRYDENSAGGLMAKELIKVNENWTVTTCVREMRAQAEYVTRVHSIYVVDNENVLKGRLSLKDLLISPNNAHIKDVYIPKVDYVSVNEDPEEVAKIMAKYDLEAIPVVDEMKRLVGRITIDDIVDVIKEEADKDYQQMAGITQDVYADDSILDLTRARLPWLIVGLVGGLGAAFIMGTFESIISDHAILFFFTPLIAAMAGNVGVQSSAIIVQGIANDDIKGSIGARLSKELFLSLLNGLILAVLLFLSTWIWKGELLTASAVSLSLIAVIIIAGLVGTFIPLFLDKRGIDPAVATGPFITTSNDIFGILIYFWIAKLILGL